MLTEPRKFFDACRSGVMGPGLDDQEVSGANAIMEACAGLPVSWCAYALATAWKETGHTMQPIKEFGGDRYFFRRYDPQGQNSRIARALGNTVAGDGARYAGRGYVQLTGRSNYAKAGAKLGIDLLGNPDLALKQEHAARIMRFGMKDGWFTGKSFASYLPAAPADKAQFRQARRIINGTDCADEIAGYAMKFQDALNAGGWQ